MKNDGTEILESFALEILLREKSRNTRRINERLGQGEGILAWLDSAFKGFGVKFDDEMRDMSNYSLDTIKTSSSDNFESAIKNADLEGVDTPSDLNIKDEKHRKAYFLSIAPAFVKILKKASVALESSKNIKSWTPPKDKAKQKAWSNENKDDLDKFYSAVGIIDGALKPLAAKGLQPAKEVLVDSKKATENPGNAVKYVARACQNLKTIWSADKDSKFDIVVKEIDKVASINRDLSKMISRDAKEKM
jgi:hypothetical protein